MLLFDQESGDCIDKRGLVFVNVDVCRRRILVLDCECWFLKDNAGVCWCLMENVVFVGFGQRLLVFSGWSRCWRMQEFDRESWC